MNRLSHHHQSKPNQPILGDLSLFKTDSGVCFKQDIEKNQEKGSESVFLRSLGVDQEQDQDTREPTIEDHFVENQPIITDVPEPKLKEKTPVETIEEVNHNLEMFPMEKDISKNSVIEFEYDEKPEEKTSPEELSPIGIDQMTFKTKTNMDLLTRTHNQSEKYVSPIFLRESAIATPIDHKDSKGFFFKKNDHQKMLQKRPVDRSYDLKSRKNSPMAFHDNAVGTLDEVLDKIFNCRYLKEADVEKLSLSQKVVLCCIMNRKYSCDNE